MTKTVLALTLISALLFLAVAGTQLKNLVHANFIQLPVPEHSIEIQKDGSVVGTENIQRNGTVYTFTSDIFGSVVVFRDDIVIDGAGHALQGDGNSTGFFLQGRYDVTIRNVRISNFSTGIEIVPRYEIQDYEVFLPLNTHFVLQGNTIANTETGIYDLFAQDVTISENTISDNEEGIFCWSTENLLVYGNNVSSNGIGIKMLFCQGSVYHNSFVNNTLQINSDGGIYGNDPSIIVWDNGGKGNYWSDYNGTDANYDGVGDTPHIFDVNYTDYYPLMNTWEPPLILVVCPKNKPYPTSSVPLNFTVDRPTSWIGYSLDGSDNVTVTGNTTLSGLSSGVHSLTVYAEDMYGNVGASETIYFRITEPFPTTLVVAASGASIAVVGAGVLFYLRKYRRRS
jgi:parallel beta-helix repeat protein